MSLLMVEVDEDLAVAPYHVASLEVAKRHDERVHQEIRFAVWGVLVVMAAGNAYFRPVKEDTRDAARELMARWRRLINGEGA